MGDRGPGDDESRQRDRRERDRHERHEERRERSSGFSFRLPPLKFPSAVFPENLRFVLPPPGREHDVEVRPRNVLVVAVLVDLLDAAAILLGVDPLVSWLRVGTGTVLAVVLVGALGLLYAWEALALALGMGWLGVVPSATLLVLSRARREVDLVQGWHPEEVDRVAEPERQDPRQDQRRSGVGQSLAAEADESAEDQGRHEEHDRDEQDGVDDRTKSGGEA